MSEEEKKTRRTRADRAMELVEQMTMDETVEFAQRMHQFHAERLTKLYGELKAFGLTSEQDPQT